jgi:hypothetical protein
MKKLLIIMCLLPMASFAQTTIKSVSLPELVIDSATKLCTLRTTILAEGANNENLAVVLNKWVAQNYTATNNVITATGNDGKVIRGEGLITGAVASKRLENNTMGERGDKLMNETPSVNYKVRFIVEVIVTDGKYEITIDHLTLEFFDVVTPFEQYYAGVFPTVPIPAENRGTDLGDVYVHMFENINFELQGVAKSAQKYITKARKKADF